MVSVRRATPEDYDALIPLFNAFVESDRYSNRDNDSYHRVLKNPSNHVFVAEDDGAIVGFVTFSVRDVLRYPKPICELDEIFVDPTYRRQKVGKLLLDTVLKVSKDMNCYRVFIESHWDRKAMHAFLESLGFTNYGYHFIKDL